MVFFAQAPNFQFKHISQKEGLSQGVVNSVFKDSHGFIWMTTFDGINRFDGIKIKHNNAIAPGELKESAYHNISEDEHRNIWFTSIGGITVFDYKSNRFITYKYDIKSNPEFDRVVFSNIIRNMKGKYIVIGTENRFILSVFNTEKRLFEKIILDKYIVNESLRPIYDWILIPKIDDPGFLYYIKKDKGNRLQWAKIEDKKIDRFYMITPITDNYFGLHVNDQVTRQNNTFKEKGIFYIIDRDKGKVIYTISSEYSLVNSIVDEHHIIFGTDEGGLLFYDKNTFQYLYSIKHDPNMPNSLTSNKSYIALVKDDVLWSNTWGRGLDYTVKTNTTFSYHLSNEEAKLNHTSNFIRGIVEDSKGHFYCNTLDRGIIHLNENLSYISTLKNTEQIQSAMLYIDENDQLYFGNKGLKKYDLKNNRMTDIHFEKRLKYVPFSFHYNEFHYAYKGKSTLYFASMYGIYALKDAELKGIEHLRSFNVNGYEEIIFEDTHENIYVYNSFLGLSVLDGKDLSKKIKFQFSNEIIPRHFYAQNDSILWIGTTTGLIQFNSKSCKPRKHFTQKDGLINNVVYAVAPDKYNHLWLSTNKGLSRFDLSTSTFKNYGSTYYNSSIEFNRHSVCVARDGRILFGGVNGITVVYPDSIKSMAHVPIIQFTKVSADTSLNPFQHFDLKNRAILKAGSDFIQFDFSAIDYMEADQLLLKYKLEGVDKNWIVCANPGTIRYNHLPPGQYKFTVVSTDVDGNWSDNKKSFFFEIEKYFYEELWFLVLTIIIFLALCVIGVRNFLKRKLYMQKAKFEKEVAIMRERSRISADLHDDIGATLSSISIYSELADKHYESNPTRSKEIVGKIAQQTKSLLSRVENIIYSLKNNNDTELGFSHQVNEYYQALLIPANIECQIDIDESITIESVGIQAYRNMLLIIKEAFNNISKYSMAKNVQLSLVKIDHRIILIIKDNGVGFDSRIVNYGNGILNMQKRCDILGGTFVIESNIGKGTLIKCTFTIELLRNKHLTE